MGPAGFEGEIKDEHTEVVSVTGELDMSTSSELRRRVEACIRNGRTAVIIDLTGLTHMDSSGLAALISAHQLTQERRGRLALVITSESLRRTVEVRGLDRLFKIVPGRDEALAYVRPTQP
ncbi:MAG: anti-sigma factor antagonist [Solirubrobacteraceae bacterium]|jgi:anti-anti-sigma factor|nr:anti-sigma factor antagonist [Solirubrobacteraceae bacterium]